MNNGSSLFLFLGLSGLERMHSQMIAWMFSDDNHALSPEEKRDLLRSVFPACTGERILYVTTEHKNVDLIIETDEETLFVENKVKTLEHSNQLAKYSNQSSSYKRKDSMVSTDLESRFYFLSLIDRNDLPRLDNNSSERWMSTTYKRLRDALSHTLESTNGHDDSPFDRQAVVQYQRTIDLIVKALDTFLNNHTAFPSVFTDGSGRKHDKELNLCGNEDIDGCMHTIQRGNLETSFQIAFMFKLRRHLENKLKLRGQKFGIGESRGNGIIDAMQISSFKACGKQYDFGVQIQSGSAKLTFQLRDCWGRGDEIRPLCELYERSVNEAINDLGSSTNFRQLNEPQIRKRKNKTLSRGNGYMSMSGPLFSKSEGPWYSHPFDEIAARMSAAISDGIGIVKHIETDFVSSVCEKLAEKNQESPVSTQ